MTTENRTHDDAAPAHEQTERLTRKVAESAQQIWLAGLGALGRAQAEGSKLFDSLVREGENYEQRSRLDPERGAPLRDSVEHTFDRAKERVTGAWGKMEGMFEDQVQSALRRLNIPTREEIDALNQRIETLNARLNRAETRASQAQTAAAAASASSTGNTPSDPPQVD